GVKESTGSIDHTSEIIQRLGRNFFVMSGDDSLTLPLMAVGATGVISVVANLVPSVVAELVSACLIQDYQRAQDLHLKLFPLVKAMFIETNPAAVKTAMYEARLIRDEGLRLPMVTVSKDTRKKIKAAMKGFKV